MRARDAFTPTFWQKLVGTDKKIRAELEQKTAAARNLDEAVYQDVLKLHHNQLERWEGLTRLARIIAEGDVTAYREAFEELSPLSEMEDAGCSFEVNFSDAKSAHVRLLVESERVVPREAKSLTKTGKLNSKPLPQGRFFELYQDYVCGCVLRTSRELFAFLPLRRVILNVDATLLDSATGHLREQTILSAGISRATLEHLNFSAVDPSDAMRLFPHRMGFKRSQGFHPIEPLAPSEYPILDQSDSIAANIPS